MMYLVQNYQEQSVCYQEFEVLRSIYFIIFSSHLTLFNDSGQALNENSVNKLQNKTFRFTKSAVTKYNGRACCIH